jgi:hypothetical protein
MVWQFNPVPAVQEITAPALGALAISMIFSGQLYKGSDRSNGA